MYMHVYTQGHQPLLATNLLLSICHLPMFASNQCSYKDLHCYKIRFWIKNRCM